MLISLFVLLVVVVSVPSKFANVSLSLLIMKSMDGTDVDATKSIFTVRHNMMRRIM